MVETRKKSRRDTYETEGDEIFENSDEESKNDDVIEQSQGPSFEKLTVELLKYRNLVKEIQYKSRRTIRLGMFEIHADDLILALQKRAEGIADKVLDKILEDHRNKMRS